MAMASYLRSDKSKIAFEMHVNVCHFLKLTSGNVPFYFRQKLMFFFSFPTIQANKKSLNILQGSALCIPSRSLSKY